MKKEILKIVIKLLVLAWLFLLGIFAFSSCSASHHLKVEGSGVVVTYDTIRISHGGFLNTKNYVPYR